MTALERAHLQDDRNPVEAGDARDEAQKPSANDLAQKLRPPFHHEVA
jgi:hypothetical protein